MKVMNDGFEWQDWASNKAWLYNLAEGSCDVKLVQGHYHVRKAFK